MDTKPLWLMLRLFWNSLWVSHVYIAKRQTYPCASWKFAHGTAWPFGLPTVLPHPRGPQRKGPANGQKEICLPLREPIRHYLGLLFCFNYFFVPELLTSIEKSSGAKLAGPNRIKSFHFTYRFPQSVLKPKLVIWRLLDSPYKTNQ